MVPSSPGCISCSGRARGSRFGLSLAGWVGTGDTAWLCIACLRLWGMGSLCPGRNNALVHLTPSPPLPSDFPLLSSGGVTMMLLPKGGKTAQPADCTTSGVEGEYGIAFPSAARATCLWTAPRGLRGCRCGGTRAPPPLEAGRQSSHGGAEGWRGQK